VWLLVGDYSDAEAAVECDGEVYVVVGSVRCYGEGYACTVD